MGNDNKTGESAEVVAASTHAIAQRSAALASRGLRNLSGWDSSRVIEAGKALTSCIYQDQLLQILMDRVEEFLKPPRCSLMLANANEKELYYELAVGKGAESIREQRIKFGHGVAGYVAENCHSIVITNAGKDERFSGNMEAPWEKEAQSIVAVPLRGSDMCLGVLELFDCVGPNGFPQSDLGILESLADFASIALKNARHVMKAHSWSITDEQTGLYNGRHLEFILDTEIWRSQRYGYEFSLVHISLKELAGPNDLANSLNHRSFIQLLGEIAKTMKDLMRLIDFVFLDNKGDIFFVLPQTNKENSRNTARRLHTIILETIWLEKEGLRVHLTPSVGLASFPDDAMTGTDLLRLADEAMRLVKNSTGDGVND
jgi:diguanylate cyclase (GGDEF)-like protein